MLISDIPVCSDEPTKDIQRSSQSRADTQQSDSPDETDQDVDPSPQTDTSPQYVSFVHVLPSMAPMPTSLSKDRRHSQQTLRYYRAHYRPSHVSSTPSHDNLLPSAQQRHHQQTRQEASKNGLGTPSHSPSASPQGESMSPLDQQMLPHIAHSGLQKSPSLPHSPYQREDSAHSSSLSHRQLSYGSYQRMLELSHPSPSRGASSLRITAFPVQPSSRAQSGSGSFHQVSEPSHRPSSIPPHVYAGHGASSTPHSSTSYGSPYTPGSSASQRLDGDTPTPHQLSRHLAHTPLGATPGHSSRFLLTRPSLSSANEPLSQPHEQSLSPAAAAMATAADDMTASHAHQLRILRRQQYSTMRSTRSGTNLYALAKKEYQTATITPASNQPHAVLSPLSAQYHTVPHLTTQLTPSSSHHKTNYHGNDPVNTTNGAMDNNHGDFDENDGCEVVLPIPLPELSVPMAGYNYTPPLDHASGGRLPVPYPASTGGHHRPCYTHTIPVPMISGPHYRSPASRHSSDSIQSSGSLSCSPPPPPPPRSSRRYRSDSPASIAPSTASYASYACTVFNINAGSDYGSLGMPATSIVLSARPNPQ